MDYSKLSTEDLIALKNGDYGKLSTGALIYLKQNAPATGPDLSQLQAEDQPVQPASVLSDVLKGGGQGTEALGTLAATGGDLQQAAQVAQAQPATTTAGKIGKFVGGLASPASVGAAALTGGVGEALAPAAKAALGVGRMGPEELAAAQKSLAGLPAKYVMKEQALNELEQQAGKGIEAAQSARGIGMTQAGIPEVPKDLNDFANSMLEISKETPENLAKGMDLEGLQGLKDTITVARQSGGLSEAQSAMLSKAADKIDSAISTQAPEIGDTLKTFRTVKDAQANLANERIVEKMKIQNAIRSIREDMRMNPATKVAKITAMLAKWGAGGATAAVAGKTAYNHMGF